MELIKLPETASDLRRPVSDLKILLFWNLEKAIDLDANCLKIGIFQLH